MAIAASFLCLAKEDGRDRRAPLRRPHHRRRKVKSKKQSGAHFFFGPSCSIDIEARTLARAVDAPCYQTSERLGRGHTLVIHPTLLLLYDKFVQLRSDPLRHRRRRSGLHWLTFHVFRIFPRLPCSDLSPPTIARGATRTGLSCVPLIL
ncbi:hypothetical protein IE81DRAFT_201369 [Ceraceosorus guamensis]|uniref:Uncharacterized protein n=1 Tax=Ceraceosorus guamensis TaxID=1522189 RepID=A0A316VTV9_9BASI|nr:hypothetical protein IE81DRAFT_201369 [Ceraceosorus guamensis]PWN40840.1 hypothetical protein IE81DRAFT_201369 [Ceraceosorus guamensis]